MATDGPDPKPCDPLLFQNGVCIGIFETTGACAFESLIQRASIAAGVPIDWHYCGGRARVVAFPENEAAAKASLYSIAGHVRHMAGYEQTEINYESEATR